MGISQSIFDEIHSNFLWLFLTLLWREPCLLDPRQIAMQSRKLSFLKMQKVFGYKKKLSLK